MKFSAALVSVAVLLAGSVQAVHVKRADHNNIHRRHNSPSGVYTPPAQTTQVSAPAPTTTASTGTTDGTSTGAKRGLAFNDPSLCKNFDTSKFAFSYNWFSSNSGSLPSGVEYFSMLWSSDASKTGIWNNDATAAIASGTKHLLAFNEPDLSSQANMSPESAAQAFQTYMNPFSGKAKLIGPAVTNGAAPMGTAWLDNFIAACNGQCKLDGHAFHIYDSASNVDYFKNYITDFVNKYSNNGQLEIYLTEFGATGTADEQAAFLQQMIPFLDGLEHLTGYAYFGVLPNSLVNSDGSLTTIGQTYKNT
ncbi:hypothetical protein QCA50_007368 [Cerrena zonata]|uniref:Asl1-like glycosyl hydrolase catalytic domain-containing protein n=1 Tax=Cerrena zonata TaxID=2478898 RepID=A0AAW0G9U3_9APHY